MELAGLDSIGKHQDEIMPKLIFSMSKVKAILHVRSKVLLLFVEILLSTAWRLAETVKAIHQ